VPGLEAGPVVRGDELPHAFHDELATHSRLWERDLRLLARSENQREAVSPAGNLSKRELKEGRAGDAMGHLLEARVGCREEGEAGLCLRDDLRTWIQRMRLYSHSKAYLRDHFQLRRDAVLDERLDDDGGEEILQLRHDERRNFARGGEGSEGSRGKLELERDFIRASGDVV
jgi:hypothetical protein